MTPKERHEESVKAITSCICGGREVGEIFYLSAAGFAANGLPRTKKPDRLCSNELPGAYNCSLEAGHEGYHVACGGELGPHAIASWDNSAGRERPQKKQRNKS